MSESLSATVLISGCPRCNGALERLDNGVDDILIHGAIGCADVRG
jgi:hypothetical protein